MLRSSPAQLDGAPLNIPNLNYLINYYQIYGEFGYDCQKQGCYIIPTKDGEQKGLSKDAGMNVIGAGIPSVIILISYGYIWFKSRQNESRTNNLLHKKSVNESDKLARTLLLICLSYLLFVVPFITYSAFIDVGFFEGNQMASITIYSFYWLQFCTNIFIYALSNEKYRKAYVFFLKHVLFKSCVSQGKKIKPNAVQNAVFFTVSDQTVHCNCMIHQL